MEPTLEQLEKYRQYLLSKKLESDLTLAIKAHKRNILREYPEIESEDFVIDSLEEEIRTVLSIDPQKIVAVEAECVSEYDDEGSNYRIVEALTLYLGDEEEMIDLGYDNADGVIDDMQDYAELFYEVGKIVFSEIKKPFSFTVTE